VNIDNRSMPINDPNRSDARATGDRRAGAKASSLKVVNS
jgi:hypothetical protein